MNRIDDEKLKFYLRNERQIDEWAAIGTRVPDELDRFLLGCGHAVEELGRAVGAEFVALLDGVWPKLLLVKPAWKTATTTRMGIGVQWHRGVATFTKGERTVVGVWVLSDTPSGVSLSNIVKARLSESNLLGGYSSERWWPAWRYETAPQGYWDDLEPFRKQILSSVRATWERFLVPLEDAFSSVALVP